MKRGHMCKYKPMIFFPITDRNFKQVDYGQVGTLGQFIPLLDTMLCAKLLV